MAHPLAATLAALLAACAQAPVREAPAARASAPLSAAPVFVLQNPGFEDEFPDQLKCPPKWNCRVHADGRSFRFASAPPATGTRALLIERIGIEHWATVEQSIPAAAVQGRRLRFSLSMKSDRIVGLGGGPFILVVGPASYHEHKLGLRTGTADWQRIAIEVDVPAGVDRVEVGALLEAEGRLWVDDAAVEILPKSGS